MPQRRIVNAVILLIFAGALLYAPVASFAQEVLPDQPAVETSTPAPPAPPKIDSGDTAWMLTSSALVLLMTAPGLALFYAGLVRRKNALGTIMQSFITLALISVQWA